MVCCSGGGSARRWNGEEDKLAAIVCKDVREAYTHIVSAEFDEGKAAVEFGPGLLCHVQRSHRFVACLFARCE